MSKSLTRFTARQTKPNQDKPKKIKPNIGILIAKWIQPLHDVERSPTAATIAARREQVVSSLLQQQPPPKKQYSDSTVKVCEGHVRHLGIKEKSEMKTLCAIDTTPLQYVPVFVYVRTVSMSVYTYVSLYMYMM
jgi:hypothetical protein